MSPVLARAAVRATLRAAAQGRQARQFSVMQTMRNMARSFEPHPFQRLPITSQPQAADWSKLFKRSFGSAMIYFPGFGLVLGWPWLAKLATDGSIGGM